MEDRAFRLNVSGVYTMVNGMQLIHCPLAAAHEVPLIVTSTQSPFFLPPNRAAGGPLRPLASFVTQLPTQANLDVMGDTGKLEISAIMYPGYVSQVDQFCRVRVPFGAWPALAGGRSKAYGGVSIVVELLVHYEGAVDGQSDAARGAAAAPVAAPAHGHTSRERAHNIFVGELRFGFDMTLQAHTVEYTPIAVTRYVAHYPHHFTLRATVCVATADGVVGLPVGTHGIAPLSASEPYHPDEAVLVEELLAMLADKSIFPHCTSTPHTNVHNRIKELAVYDRVVAKHCRGRWLHFLASHPEAVLLVKEPGQEVRVAPTSDALTYAERDRFGAELRARDEEAAAAMIERELRDSDVEYRSLLDKMMTLGSFRALLTPSAVMFERFLSAHKDLFWIHADHVHTTRVGLVTPPLTD